MKLFLFLNEHQYGAHIDVHNACSKLVGENKIHSCEIFPFREKLNMGVNTKQLSLEIAERLRAFKPELILFSHTGGLNLDLMKIINNVELKFKPAIGYWDGDIYHKIFKPLPNEVNRLIKVVDVCFWCGFDSITRKLSKKNRKDFRYVPLSTDERFAKEIKIYKSNTDNVMYDIVMVGNFISKKIPYFSFPGSKYRKEIADYIYDKIGDKFAVFGYGWDTKYAKGMIPFEEQCRAYHSAKIAIGVNNLFADYYFSNRLPISLSCGKIMLHNYEHGVENIFNDSGFDYFFKDKYSLWQMANSLLQKTNSELNEEATKYQKFASEKIATYNNLDFMIMVLKDYYSKHNYLTNIREIENPWTKKLEPYNY